VTTWDGSSAILSATAGDLLFAKSLLENLGDLPDCRILKQTAFMRLNQQIVSGTLGPTPNARHNYTERKC